MNEYKPKCDVCPHYNSCTVQKALKTFYEERFNRSRELAGRTDGFVNGKYVKEAVDSIYSDYNTCKTYYIKDFGDRDTISHIPYLIRVRDEMREIHPLAGNAIDSLINRRALIEYNKAKEDNTEEAWRLYYRVIPSEYRINK